VAGRNLAASSKATNEAQSRWAAGASSAGADLFGEPRRTTNQETPMLPSNSLYLSDGAVAENSELVKLDQARKAAETDVIMKALYSTQWNRKRSAKLLGIDYKALLYKMKKLGID
jgi:DNA-binding NtrC family response regulator